MSVPRLRAPQEGQILAVPALDQAPALLEGNRHSFSNVPVSFLGRSLQELRVLARREILAASTQYHLEAGETVPDLTGDAWLVAGHQPELFHPGVWFKNFALHQLATRHGTMPLNLIVDTDTAKPALLHVPADGRLARVPFDRSTAETPYEERVVEEETTFADLPERVAPFVSGWQFEPMLATFWREVMKHASRTPILGERFAAARRTMERRWGCVQREVPMSRVCQTEAFAWFACSILDDLPALHERYNSTVQNYRVTHGIRSRSHPVPDLASDGAWLEAPFWAWRHGQTRRGKLFVRRSSSAWDLRVAGEDWPSVPFANAVESWQTLQRQGYKIRSRALTTTLFARLFFADVFVHGIGGGIYDELTDRLIERHFKTPAPGFFVLSATLLLPLPRYLDAPAQARTLARQSRDLVYKPQLFVGRTAETESLIQAKDAWIRRSAVTHTERVERFEGIREVNAQLAPFLDVQKQTVQTKLAECRQRILSEEIASRRDYAFCLYPEEMLRTFFSNVIL